MMRVQSLPLRGDPRQAPGCRTSLVGHGYVCIAVAVASREEEKGQHDFRPSCLPRKGGHAQEGVAEGDFADVLHEGVVDKVAVDEEEDGQVDLFAGEEALLFEAEAFDFGEIRRDLRATSRQQVGSLPSRFLPGWGRTFIGVTL